MQNNTCTTCHAPIPASAPGGFCPACLLRDAEEPPAYGHSAPPLEEIATAFPQLEVIALIGQGGMGFVYKVRQPSLDRVVALKILSPELGSDPAFAERFSREARTLGKLHHPNIVTVFEHGEMGGFFYLIMEYVDGVNLRQAMRAGRFTPEQALAIVPGICDALQTAHEQGIWHRDIKPENILLDRDGKVKIADFGIARIVGDPQRDFTLTRTGNALGSISYMAPEQHEKPHEVDHRADIYSLGVVIYEMLTGELPLGRFPAPSRKAAVDARIDEIVFKTLEKERDLRQQSATEVKTDVHRALQPGAAAKATHGKPNAFPKAGLAKLSFGLFLAGFLSFPLIAAFAPVPTVVALISALALLLLAFVLGLASWPELLAKIVVISTGTLFIIGLVFIVVSLPFLKLKTPISVESSTPPISKEVSLPSDRLNSINEPKQIIPDVTVEEVFRKMVAAANHSDVSELSTHTRDIRFFHFHSAMPGSAPEFTSFENLRPLRMMELFTGEIVHIKVAAAVDQPTVPVAYATIRKLDGSLAYLVVEFEIYNGRWVGTAAQHPFFRAINRIEFLPQKGDASEILEMHLGSVELFRAVEGKPGQFDIVGSGIDAESAKQHADANIQRLRESLKKFGLDTAMKVISPAVIPEAPYMAEDAPPFIEPKP